MIPVLSQNKIFPYSVFPNNPQQVDKSWGEGSKREGQDREQNLIVNFLPNTYKYQYVWIQVCRFLTGNT